MPPRQPATYDRRVLCALLAAFALVIQALIPAAAMAAQPGPSGLLVICTASGTQTVAPDGKPATPTPKKGFAGMPCQDCLAAALAVATPATVTVEPVAYIAAVVDHQPAARLLRPRARAPPRPPGQGPPTA